MAEKWMQAAAARMHKKGTAGMFSKAAMHAGMDTEDYAAHIMASPTASGLMKKRANFALNAIGARAKKKSA